MKHLSEETIMGLADKMLTPAEQEEAQAHLNICSECCEQLNLYQSLDLMMSAENIMKAPPAITNRVMQQVELHQKIMLRKSKSRNTLIKFSIIMVVFMIAIIILAFVSGASVVIETPSWMISVKDILEKLRMPRLNPILIYGIASVLVLLFSERIIYLIRKHRFAVH
jgi:hypothetical protein